MPVPFTAHLLAACCAVAAASASAAEPAYAIAPLANPVAGTLTDSTVAVSNDGRVTVPARRSSGKQTPLTYQMRLRSQAVQQWKACQPSASTASPNGVVLARLAKPARCEGAAHAVLLGDGSMRLLPGDGDANDVNDAGDVVGSAAQPQLPGAPTHAMRWNADGSAIDLHTRIPGNPSSSSASSINRAGNVLVRYSRAGQPPGYGLALASGGFLDYGMLGFTSVSVSHLNKAGHSVASGLKAGMYWAWGVVHPSGGTDYRPLCPISRTPPWVVDMNRHDQMVGGCPEDKGAVMLIDDAGYHDLTAQTRAASLGWTELSAHGINDKGWIVGDGLWNGQPSGFIMKPVRP